MRSGTASTTAKLVAFMRALADAGLTNVRGFSDPVAKHLIDGWWKRRFDQREAQRKSGKTGTLPAAARRGADMLAQRTVVIDTAVRKERVQQLVILGAGLDGRAWRLPGLESARVFEVDYPATGAYKREHVQALKSVAARVDFVPIDFEREGLAEVLERAGHDRAVPTVWVWEGVVMYLTKDALRSTLRAVSERSAKGSVLVLNYHSGPRAGPVRFLLRFVGEPMISHCSPLEMRAELDTAGFDVEDDSGVTEWISRHGGSEKATHVARIAVARRR